MVRLITSAHRVARKILTKTPPTIQDAKGTVWMAIAALAAVRYSRNLKTKLTAGDFL